MDDLVKRNDLYYKKFTDVPFTGEVSGLENGKFKNGKRNGKWLSYYETGQLSFKENYKDGELDGLFESYRKTGQLHYSWIFKDGVKEGLYQEYNEDGSLQKTETYKDGEKLKNGVVLESDFLSFKTYRDGILDGPSEVYYKNRNLHMKGQFKNGIETGLHESYHKNGRLSISGYYNNKAWKTGLWVWYYDDGKISSKQNYTDGKKDGIFEFYYTDGSLKYRNTWKDGVKIK